MSPAKKLAAVLTISTLITASLDADASTPAPKIL